MFDFTKPPPPIDNINSRMYNSKNNVPINNINELGPILSALESDLANIYNQLDNINRKIKIFDTSQCLSNNYSKSNNNSNINTTCSNFPLPHVPEFPKEWPI